VIHEVGRPASALRTNKGSVARDRRGGPAGRLEGGSSGGANREVLRKIGLPGEFGVFLFRNKGP
jgi:hypothetical protein